jgi:hypothetical protein
LILGGGAGVRDRRIFVVSAGMLRMEIRVRADRRLPQHSWLFQGNSWRFRGSRRHGAGNHENFSGVNVFAMTSVLPQNFGT